VHVVRLECVPDWIHQHYQPCTGGEIDMDLVFDIGSAIARRYDLDGNVRREIRNLGLLALIRPKLIK
jgi:hypothetical protein